MADRYYCRNYLSLGTHFFMRKIHKNNQITIRALKRHQEMILSDSGRTYLITPDGYTRCIPFAEWRFWILRKKGNRYSVLKSIPMPRDNPN